MKPRLLQKDHRPLTVPVADDAGNNRPFVFAPPVLGDDWQGNIRIRYREAKRLHWRQLVLGVEILLLFGVGFIPNTLDMAANALVSFACAMQVQAFRKVHGYPFASTMCIGNLRSGMESLVVCFHLHDKKALYKALHYFGVILLFAIGAGLGAQGVAVFGNRTIWFSCALLLVSLCFMFIQDEEQARQETK